MKFETKFDNGQEVWIVQDNKHYQIIRCITCDSKGKIFLKEQEFICPGCDGRSSRRNYAGSKYCVSQHGRVGKVSIENQTIGYDPKFIITYMIDSTGVGSGNVYEEARLFASKAEAQLYCDQHNGLLPANEEVGEAIPESEW